MTSTTQDIDISDVQNQSTLMDVTQNEPSISKGTTTINEDNKINKIIASKRFLNLLKSSGNYPDPLVIGYEPPYYKYNLRPGLSFLANDQNPKIDTTIPETQEDMRPYNKRPFAHPQNNNNIEAENSEDSDKHQASSPPAIIGNGEKVEKDNKEGEVRSKRTWKRKISRKQFRHHDIKIFTPKEYRTSTFLKRNESCPAKMPVVLESPEAMPVSKESITEDIVNTLAGQKQASIVMQKAVNGSKSDAGKEENYNNNNNSQNINNNNIGKHHLPAIVFPTTIPRRKSMEIKTPTKNPDEKNEASKTADMPVLQTENDPPAKPPEPQNITEFHNRQPPEEGIEKEIQQEPPEDYYSPEPENLSLKRRRSSATPVDLSIKSTPAVDLEPLAQSIINRYIPKIPQETTVTMRPINVVDTLLEPNNPVLQFLPPLPQKTMDYIQKQFGCLNNYLKEPFTFSLNILLHISRAYLNLEHLKDELPNEYIPGLTEFLSQKIAFLDVQLKKIYSSIESLTVVRFLGETEPGNLKANIASAIAAIEENKQTNPDTTYAIDVHGPTDNVPDDLMKLLKDIPFISPNNNLGYPNYQSSSSYQVPPSSYPAPPGLPPPYPTQGNRKTIPNNQFGRPRCKSYRNNSAKQIQQLQRSFSSPHTNINEMNNHSDSVVQPQNENIINNNVAHTQTSSDMVRESLIFGNPNVPQLGNQSLGLGQRFPPHELLRLQAQVGNEISATHNGLMAENAINQRNLLLNNIPQTLPPQGFLPYNAIHQRPSLRNQRPFQTPASKKYAQHQNPSNIPQIVNQRLQTPQSNNYVQHPNSNIFQGPNQTLQEPRSFQNPYNGRNDYANNIASQTLQHPRLFQNPYNGTNENTIQSTLTDRMPHHQSNQAFQEQRTYEMPPNVSNDYSRPILHNNIVPQISPQALPGQWPHSTFNVMPTESAKYQRLPTQLNNPNMPESARHYYPQTLNFPQNMPRLGNPNPRSLLLQNNFPQQGTYMTHRYPKNSALLARALQTRPSATKVSSDLIKTPEIAIVPSSSPQEAPRSRRKDSNPRRAIPVVISTDTSMQITVEPTEATSDDNTKTHSDLTTASDQLRTTVIQSSNNSNPTDAEETPIKQKMDEEKKKEFQGWVDKVNTDVKLKEKFLKEVGVLIEISDSDDDEHCEVKTPSVKTELTTEEKKSPPHTPEIISVTSTPDKQPKKISLSDSPVQISIPYSPEIEPISPVNNASPFFTNNPEVPNTTKEAVSAIKQKTLLTFGDFHTSYSHKLALSDNNDPQNIEELIPNGKLRYMPEQHAFLRYHDYAQAEMFLKSLESDEEFLTQVDINAIRNAYKNILDTGLNKSKQTELITLPEHIVFTEMECLEDVEKYICERKLADIYVPADFSRFYAYVTGFQIYNKNPPISLRTFLTMYNTNRLLDLMRKYLIEKGCGNNLVVNTILPKLNKKY